MAELRLLLADDHSLFRRGLISLLNETGEFQVVGEAASGPEAVRQAGRLQPDLVLLDVHMPGGGGLEALRQLRAAAPALPVLMLTVSENDADLLDAIRAGAAGYLLKNAETDELFTALRRAAAGQRVLAPTLLATLFQQVAQPAAAPPASPLTPREAGILEGIAAGRTNREIAVQLQLSENTVKTHIARILQKLAVTTRAEAVSVARRNRWLPTGDSRSPAG